MLVRVRDSLTGHHYTIEEAVVEADPKRYRKVKSPAVDHQGRPVPPKFNITDQADQATDQAEEAIQ